MSTVADDLLNDFGSSGDEASDHEQQDDGLVESATNGNHDSMDVDGQENNSADGNSDEDGDETKNVEKMQLGGVNDVRSVAKLMETLTPVLEVSIFSVPSHGLLNGSFTSNCMRISPDETCRTLAENRTLPRPSRRTVRDGRKHRGPPRVPPAHAVEQPLYTD